MPRVRPTLRCLRDDLRIPLPRPAVSLDDLDHPVLMKARELASNHPANQKHLESIRDVQVFRFTHGRLRVVTWLESSSGVLWICACGIRAEGQHNDIYEHVRRLHQAGALLPTDDDRRRDHSEDATRLLRRLRDQARSCLADAERFPGEERNYRLDERIEITLYVDQPGEFDEIWLSISLRTEGGTFLGDRLKQMVFAVFEEAARETEWEERRDWPPRELEWWEIARLGVRERRR